MESMDAMLLLGFQFIPTDEELISHYLGKKVKGEELSWDGIPDCDLYGEKSPWEICGDQEDKIFDNKGNIIGAKKLFNFNVIAGLTTKNSNWIMHEFSLVDKQQQSTNLEIWIPTETDLETNMGCLPASDHSDFNFDLETIMSMLPLEGGDLPLLPPLEDFCDADFDAFFV
ncbi:NAC domain-containing protein 41-like [Alnus glutinosa]|uniref:NAC domain-containing protein 41-like n=1 Tax=Alnus glutinosa TaxID=3517 RepID=UPI002D76F537|nr:NAC domain-containing protein 41-like [Alnus glutinosa]